MIAIYARVSTPEQSLSRQVENTLEYTLTNYDVDLETQASPMVIADAIEDGIATNPATHGDVNIYYDKQTGTNTDRDGYKQLLDAVRDGEGLEGIVANSVSRISRSIRDLDRTVDVIVEDHDTELVFLQESLEFVPGDSDPFQRAMFRMLGVFAELEADLARERTLEGLATRQNNPEYHHGRPPLGFNKNDGTLVEAENYDRVRTILQQVEYKELSKRKAAKVLDTSRRTINRALERKEMYNLTEDPAAV